VDLEFSIQVISQYLVVKSRARSADYKASLSGNFMESFMTLNIIIFANMARREKGGVSLDVRRVSSP
jgi:hypothetical protein